MTESTTIVAFDQHANSVVAGVLGAGDQTPALHPLSGICRRSEGLSLACSAVGPCSVVMRPAPWVLNSRHLEPGSSRRITVMRYPTREYQSDQPSLTARPIR